MLQVAHDISVVLEKASQHPNVQLEGPAFPHLPQEPEDYISFFETLAIRVDSLAEGLSGLMRYGCTSAHQATLFVLVTTACPPCSRYIEFFEVLASRVDSTAGGLAELIR